MKKDRAAAEAAAAETSPAPIVDRFTLYEHCVQRPDVLVPALRRWHGGVGKHAPIVLHEDFCGTAAISREWTRTDGAARAVATDWDPDAINRGKTDRAALLAPDAQARLKLRLTDVCLPFEDELPSADVIFVGNFSLGELHQRADLVRYLRSARARLAPRGVFVCDNYDGASSLRTGTTQRTHPLPPPFPSGTNALYTWDQRSIDVLTGRVENRLHFRVRRGDEVTHDFPDAFIYRWRKRSFAELTEALEEAGFERPTLRTDLKGDQPLLFGSELPPETETIETVIGCLVTRVAPADRVTKSAIPTVP